MPSHLNRFGFAMAGLLLMCCPFLRAPAQQAQNVGTVSGAVVDAVTKRPMAGVEVIVDDGRTGTRTNEDGRYTIRNLSLGEHSLSTRYIGYARGKQSVSISSTVAQVDFSLAETVKTLDAVVTTGSKTETAIREAPTPVNVISSQQIQQQGVNKVDQLFKGQIPGMIALQPGPYDYVTYTFARGGSDFNGASKVKVYVDGVEMTDGNYLSNINASNIERVEVIRGPQASTIYGSEAANGVVQIFTKKGLLNQPIKSEVSLSAGGITGPLLSPNQYKPQYDEKVSFSGGGQDLSFNTGFSYLKSGEWTPGYKVEIPAGFGTAQTTFGNLLAQVSARFSNRDSKASPGDPRVVYKARSGLYAFPNYYQGNDSSFMNAYLTGFYPYDDYSYAGRTYGLNLTYSPTADWTTSGVIGYDNMLTQFIRSPDSYSWKDTTYSVYYYNQAKTSYTGSTTYKRDMGPARATLTGGGDYWDFTYDYHYQTGAQRAAGNVVAGNSGSSTIIRQPLRNGGFYEQLQVGFRDQLFFVAGSRTEFHPGFGKDLTWLDRTAPRIGVSYTPEIGPVSAKLRASYGTAFTPPAFSQIYAINSATATYVPNTDLKPQKQNGGDAGVELYFGRNYSLNATYYNQFASDLIALQYITPFGYIGTAASPAIYQYRNVGEIKNTGVEFEGHANLNPISLTGTWTIQHSVPTKLYTGYVGPAIIGTQLWRVPYHLGGLNARYTTRKLTLGTDITFIGKRRSLYYGPYYDRLYVQYQHAYTGNTYTDYFGWHPEKKTYNLNATFDVKNSLSLFGRIDNVTNNMLGDFDDDYVVQGRSFMLGFRLRN